MTPEDLDRLRALLDDRPHTQPIGVIVNAAEELLDEVERLRVERDEHKELHDDLTALITGAFDE